jgi:general secretion pathway protein A
LSGQQELEEKLKLPQLRQLRQRIMLRCKTSPLTKEQTHDYIAERLRIAGASGELIFDPKSVETIHLYSLGIPRVVNLLCEHSLINAYVEQQRPISPKIVEDVAREFQLDEVEPTAPPESLRTSQELYNSEAFVQNLGEALSRFRVSPHSPSSRERK